MTGPGEDSQKHKSDDAAKYLAESFFGLNLNPADVGGEVLFDDYDDSRTVQLAGDSPAKTSADLDDSVAAFASAIAGRSSVPSPPNRFEENLDDLIVFSDDDDDEDDVQVDDDEDDDDDDENFDFGDEDEDDEEDEEDLDEDEDFDEEEEDDEDEDEDELDDVDLDFGDDVMPPAPKKVVPVAQDSRSARSERSSAARDTQRSTPQHRGERSAERGVRPQESSSARAESRASDRPPVAKSTDTGRKSAPSDDQYWNELDGWVWDDEAKKKPAAVLPPDDDDIDDDDDRENAETSPSSRAGEDEDAPKRKRGRRRGGRGRGRGRRDEKEPATSAPSASDSQRGSVDFDDDFSEIMFEEDQEDFVSVSAGSAKAQRRLQDEPTTPAARKHENEIDEEDDEDSVEATERVETGDNRSAGSRRGRRGRRGRGRARTEGQEPARGDDRSAARAPRTIRNEDEIDDDVVDDDIELSEFSEQDDEEELPRRSRGTRTEQPPRSQGRGRGGAQRDPAPRPVESTERPRRQPVKEPRSASADEPDNRRNPRPARVAAEFQDIPTWEEAIGSLAIRTPTEEHARRAENRGRRDGGRPPRRKN